MDELINKLMLLLLVRFLNFYVSVLVLHSISKWPLHQIVLHAMHMHSFISLLH